MTSKRESVTFEEWVKRTMSNEPLDRCEAVEQFPELEDETQVAGILVSILDDEDELVRVEAAEQLAFFELEPVRQALWLRLSIEESELVKGYLLSSIGQVGDLRDLQPLLELSESPSSRVQWNALVGLHRLVSRHVTQKLRGLVNASPRESGPPITALMVFLHVFWLRNIEEFVDDTESVLDPTDGIWAGRMTSLKRILKQLDEFQ